ncbi:MAG TPA: amino acid adenylation domain-containing protein, partial [Albitalea sp.]
EHMVPGVFVKLDALPLTPNGKLDRQALPAPQAQAGSDFEAPQGEIETTLAAIWAELLQLERVGRHDNFFHLGGHSLLAVRLVSRVQQALGVQLELATLFERPVLQALAQSIREAARTALPPIAVVPRDRALPLSFAQRRLWFLAQMAGASRAYHIALSLRLTGRLDRVALRRALDRILERHEALRTTFGLTDGEPQQHVSPPQPFPLREHDFSGELHAATRLQSLVDEEAGIEFDLARGPLIRGRLVTLGDDDHGLIVTMHHIVSDGWSVGVFSDELSALYGAFGTGGDDPLPPLEIQYADYAAWQRHWLSGEVLDAHAAYWRDTLAGAPTRLELPTDRPRPPEQDHAGGAIGFELDAEVSAGLRALSQRHGTTLFMTLLAGWAVLLSRLSGQHDLVIGTPTANRSRRELEPLIGFFTNTLALRVDLSGSPTVAQLLQRVKAQAVAAQAHQDLPFEQVVEIVKPPRSLAHTPLFQVLFSWQSSAGSTLELPGLQLQPLGAAHATAQFDLALNLFEAQGRIGGGLEYASALFDRSTVERHLACLRELLAGMAADDARTVDRLPLLPADEQRRLLVDCNATQADWPRESCVHELIEAQVQRTPVAVALAFEDSRISYAELNERANRLARHLRAIGVGPDRLVGLCLERSVDMAVGLLAVLKAGGAYVPLDPALPPARLAAMCEDCAPVAVLTHARAGTEARAAMRLALSAHGEVPLIDMRSDARRWKQLPADDLPRAAEPEHLAYVIYTSGSTGRPKGVMLEHRGVTNYLWWAAQAYRPVDGAVVSSSLSFDATVTSLLVPLLVGGTVRLLPERQEVEGLEAQVRAGCGLVKITPAHLDVLGQRLLSEGARGAAGLFVIGGEALSASTVGLWRRLQPGVRLVNEYGPTETVVGCVVHDVPAQVDLARAIPIGRPIANTRIYVLDAHRQPVPVGVVGELYIGGAGVARGYLNRPELTAERFVDDPFAGMAGERMYKTGDLARWLPDGTLDYLGRNDFQVKVRGFRIEPGEIETRLLQHPALREAVVLAREDQPGDKRLVAYCTLADDTDTDADAEALREHLASTLPDYMVPAAFVVLDALPLTANGKLDRSALPAPDAQAYGRQGYEAPEGEVEQTIARIWGDVLQMERIGRHDDFFELGGHSLLAVKVASRMREAGLHADVGVLFATPTLAALAAAVGGTPGGVRVPANGIPSGCTAIAPEMLPLVKLTQAEIDGIVEAVPGGAPEVQDIYPLAPLQEGILFHHLMERQGDLYLTRALFSFDRREQLDRYLLAMASVIERHDILRTGIVWEGLAEPVQVVRRHAVMPIEEIDVDPAGGEAAQQLAERFDPRSFRIDVREAPLMRAVVAHDRVSGRWLMLWLLHHLVADHTTLEMVRGEIEAHLMGTADRLPAPLPFRNFVAQARLGVSRDEHEAFFRKMLGGVTEPTVPFGLTDVQGTGHDIAETHRFVDTALATRMRRCANAAGVTAASLCHLAWAQVLARISGRDDVVFGTVLFGRMRGGEGAERVLGLFLNTLPLRLQLGGRSVQDALRDTHETMGELLRHEHAPLALAQRCSAVPAGTPLFSALLNYRHGFDAGREGGPAPEVQRAWSGIEFLGSEERTNYPLMLAVGDLGEGFVLTAQTRSGVDPQRICDLMHAALERLVEALEQAAPAPADRLDVLPPAERRRVLHDWNQTQAAYPHECGVHELIERQAARTPQAVAAVHESRCVRYGELDAQANRLAHHLREQGVTTGTRVAICMERGLDMLVGLLATWK